MFSISVNALLFSSLFAINDLQLLCLITINELNMANFKARSPPVFCPSTSDYNAFNEWRREFEIFVAVTNHFTEEVSVKVQQARLFNLAGPDFVKFVRQFCTITDESTVTTILNSVEIALRPKRFDLQNRAKLFEKKQRSEISAAQYLHELRELYDLSNYGESIKKVGLVRDLFIAGVASTEARCLLYQQDSDNLTVEQCLHLVSSFESAITQSSSSNSSTEFSVQAVQSNSSLSRNHQKENVSTTGKCQGCGNWTDHVRKDCPAFKIQCRACGIIGHFARVCRKVKKTTVNSIGESLSEKHLVNSLHVNNLNRSQRSIKRKDLSVLINGKKVTMLIDSGSDITVISSKLCHELGLHYTRRFSEKIQSKVVGANGSSIKMLGIIEKACIETSKGFLIDNVWIAENLSTEAIFGQSSLSAFQSLTIQYGGHLPDLKVLKLSTEKPFIFAKHPRVYLN